MSNKINIENVAGKCILVTGGTGSFGKTVIKHMLSKGCAEVRVFSRDETKQDQMRVDFDDDRIRYYIGDVRDYDSIHSAVKSVDYIFHAAALKQVPSCEFFPMQAVETNIIGSNNVLRAAVSQNVRSVVCLSTDKAVYPVNAMGMSKAIMEKIAQSHARNLTQADTIISCVRYGNVMYSRGSVIPLFVRFIKEGKPLTLTDPKMTRFLMSLNESVDLVEYAFSNASQGDTFIKRAPACTVEDLATALSNLFNVSSEKIVIGMRHGEKSYEALASAEELSRSDDFGDYFRINMDTRDLNYKKYFSEGDLNMPSQDYTSDNTTRLSVKDVEKTLLKLPEIQYELNNWQ